MATLKLKPPTQEDFDEQESLQPQNMFDPRSQTDEGLLVDQTALKGTVEQQPSRVTGATVGDVPEGYQGIQTGAMGALVRGFNDIILALPDLAINKVVDGLELAGIVDKVDEPRNFLSRVFNSSDYKAQKVIIPYLMHYGVDEYIGQTGEEGVVDKYARAVGQGGAMAVPFAGITAKGAQLSAAAPKALDMGKTVDRIKSSFFKPYQTAPAVATSLEVGAGGLASAGAQAERDIFGTNTGIGALTAVFGGPALYYSLKTAGTKGPIGRMFSWGKEKFVDAKKIEEGTLDPSAGAQGEKAKGTLTKEVEEAAATPESQINIQRAREIEETILDEGALTPAEATMDPPLLQAQVSVESRATPEFTRKNVRRKADNIAKIEKYINNELTGSALDDGPTFIVDAGTTRAKNIATKIDKDLDEVTTTLSGIKDSKTGTYQKLDGSDKRTIGENIRASIDEAHTKAKQEAEDKAGELKINKTDRLVKMDAFEQAKESIKNAVLTKEGKEALSYEQLNPLIRKFIETDKRTISFQDWKQFRDSVSSAIGRAAALKIGPELRQLAIFAKTLDELGEAYGTANVNFEKFRKFYSDNVITPFEDGFVIRVLAKAPGSTGEKVKYAIPGERVAESFLADSNSATQFMRLFGENQVMMDNMRAVVMDQVRKTAYNKNKAVFDPAKINTYVDKNKPILDILKLTDQISTGSNLIENQLARQATLTARQRNVAQNNLFQVIARAEKTNQPEKILDQALKDPKLLGQLKNSVLRSKGTDLSQEELAHAFRATITQKLLAKAPNALENPIAFKEFLVREESFLNNAFDKTHIDNMYLVADAAERVLATGGKGQPLGPQDIITSLTSKLGTTPAGISNRFIAVQEGRLGPRAAVGYILSRAIRAQSNARTDALFREMMFDPSIAKLLTNEGPTPLSVSGPEQRRLNSFLFSLGVDYNEVDMTEPAEPLEVIIEPNLPSTPNVPTTPTIGDQSSVAPVVSPSPVPSPVPEISPPTTQTASASELFPFDPTLAAIERRRNQKQGIMSVT
jgi:hypothetical protein